MDELLAEIRLDHGGIEHHVLRSALGDNLPGAEDDHPIGECHHRLHDVLDGDDAGAGIADRQHQVDGAAHVGLVDAGHDLVEEQHARAHRHHPGDLEPLEAAGGEAARLASEPGCQPHPLGGLARDRPRFADVAVAMEGADHDVLLDRHSREGLHDLEGAAEAERGEIRRAARVMPRPVRRADAHRAGIGIEEARDHVEDGGLAGPVRADQAEDLALPEREVDIVGHVQAAEALLQALDPDQVRADRRPLRGPAGTVPACVPRPPAPARLKRDTRPIIPLGTAAAPEFGNRVTACGSPTFQAKSALRSAVTPSGFPSAARLTKMRPADGASIRPTRSAPVGASSAVRGAS
jgi:hypothetical protein